jgi:hypothetical protein
MEVLREQEERAKSNETHSGRKSSMAEKVRSVTKRASGQALSGKGTQTKTSEPRSSAPSQATSAPLPASQTAAVEVPARSPKSKKRSSQKAVAGQPNGAVELPGDIPRKTSGLQDASKKSGLHLHLGSKPKSKESSSAALSPKSLNIFRRSPQSQQPPEPQIKSPIRDVAGTPSKTAEALIRAEGTHQDDSQLLAPSEPPPERTSPDPGLPTPPALASQTTPRGLQEQTSYTALPNVFATAQTATSAKAALRVSSTNPSELEPEKTPKARPSKPPGAVHQEVTLAELPSNASKPEEKLDVESKHTSYQSSLGEPGPEVPTIDAARAAEAQSIGVTEDDLTPTAAHVERKVDPSTSSQDVKVGSIDTALTSATMRSPSDFYKLPPQPTSPTPPPVTPDDIIARRPVGSNLDASLSHSKASSVHETVHPEGELGRQEPVKEALVTEQPTEEQPALDHPAREQPVQEPPAEEKPVKEPPIEEQPTSEQAARERSAHEQPVKEAPVKEEPVKGQTDAEQTVTEQAAAEQPSGELPIEPPSKPRSPQPKRAREKKASNPKDLRLQPRNKDLQNQSELLDLIASTPPTSPIHTRTSSDNSALSAVGMTPSTSRILGPPDEAPPPPAPGGRSMITPDYASAGAFEGERKSKRGSGMSGGGWKKMFAGSSGTSSTSTTNTLGVLGIADSQGDDEAIHMSANLMSGEGKDVLWYKGMGKDGLWVSGA